MQDMESTSHTVYWRSTNFEDKRCHGLVMHEEGVYNRPPKGTPPPALLPSPPSLTCCKSSAHADTCSGVSASTLSASSTGAGSRGGTQEAPWQCLSPGAALPISCCTLGRYSDIPFPWVGYSNIPFPRVGYSDILCPLVGYSDILSSRVGYSDIPLMCLGAAEACWEHPAQCQALPRQHKDESWGLKK